MIHHGQKDITKMRPIPSLTIEAIGTRVSLIKCSTLVYANTVNKVEIHKSILKFMGRNILNNGKFYRSINSYQTAM